MIPNIKEKEYTFMVTTIPCVHADNYGRYNYCNVYNSTLTK